MSLFNFIFGKAIDKRIAAFQNDLITKHVVEVENIYRQMRAWRHDYHNHIQIMKAYRALGENEKLDNYLDELDADLINVDTVIKSGNVMIDAILNSKLSLAKARQISINAKAVVPLNLAISEIDLCVIVGNMLDNAIEACTRYVQCKEHSDDDVFKHDPFIRIYMDIKRDSLYISVTNASDKPKKRGSKYLTSKEGYHGFGLMRVDNIVHKYKGYITRHDEVGAFTSEVVIPVAENISPAN